jgi:hypothetical protein
MQNLKTKIEVVYLWTALILILGAYTTQFVYFGYVEKMDPNTTQEFSNSVSKFNQLADADSLKTIRESFHRNTKDANSELDKFEKNIKELDSEILKSGDGKLLNELTKYREMVSQIVVMPDIHEVIAVLNKRIESFVETAEKNNWKNLAKSSARMSNRLISAQNRPAAFFARLENSVTDLEKELSYMKELVERANLPSGDKTLITTKLSSFRPELDILGKFAYVWAPYLEAHASFTKYYQNWLIAAGEKISLRTIRNDSISRQYYLVNLLNLGLVVLFVAFIPLVAKAGAKFRRFANERELVTQMKGSFLGPQNAESFFISDINRKEFQKVQEYIMKRMSFGSIFQDSIPFPTVILDSNLSMVWCNTHFMEKWNIGNLQNGESISWDYLRKNTNMDDVGPISNALKHHVAGIYQIQLLKKSTEMAERNSSAEHAQDAIVQADSQEPFEMYVSPIEYQGQTRITVIFYPLSSMEQTISDQAKGLIEPVRRTLDALNKGKIKEAFDAQVESDYRLAGITDIFERFTQLSDQNETVKHGLLEQIEDCENQICDLLKVITDSMAKIQEQSSLLTKTNNSFTEIKGGIISSVEERAKLQMMYENLIAITRRKDKRIVDSVKAINELKGLREDTVKIVENVKGLRAPLKETKILMDDTRSRIGQNLDMLIASVGDKLEGRNAEYLKRVREEYENLSAINTKLSGWLPSMDLYFSKLEILFANRGTEFGVADNLLGLEPAEIENLGFEAQKIEHSLNLLDSKVVSTLKEFFNSIQSLKKTNRDLTQLVENDFLRESSESDDQDSFQADA